MAPAKEVFFPAFDVDATLESLRVHQRSRIFKRQSAQVSLQVAFETFHLS